ncbi:MULTISPECIES: enoyl-CoA hydratase/isomerase family protein [Aeromicrobium]|uniref:enoyl-CoA hydratase/isomerase family protein n=1 Tax=Aeromicrobium TaxID=2040 RepID=UPI00257A30C9|nr:MULTISPECIES: enoyl-CoA hydratase-related protein [Aeromicrobium]
MGVEKTEDPVIIERGDGIARLTLNRPDRLNAMSDAMLDLFVELVADVTADEDVRVIVLTGAGRGFCVGGDLDAFSESGEAEPVTRGASIEKLHRHMRASELLRSSHAVSVAAVNGACAGAGLSLAAACDLRVSSSAAVFRSAFVDAALSGDFGGTWLLTRLIGESRAKQMAFLNEKVTPETAREWGLVSAVHAPEVFEDEVNALATTLSRKAPRALAGLKQNFIDAANLTFAEASAIEAQRHVDCSRTTDLVEAANAFLERREPHFTGS